ncbi:MAG: tetratricopeptide repeat protein [Deltaproteobacteria bacterium]
MNQDASRKTKTRLSLILTTMIIAASSITGYLYYTRYYPKRYLRQAETFKEMDDYPQAIESYKRHLLINPNDLSAKLQLAKALLRQDQTEKALEVLTIVIRESKQNQDLRKQASELTESGYSALAKQSAQTAKKALEQEQYKLAIEAYEHEYCYLEKLRPPSRSPTTKEKTNDYYMPFVLVRLLENRANLAFAYWLDEQFEKASQIISEPLYASDATDNNDPVLRYGLFASKLRDLGSKAFEGKEWDTVRRHYEEALINYKKDTSEFSKASIPEVRYGIAITHWNEGDFWKAKELLTALQKDFPEYDAEKIQSMISDSEKAGFSHSAEKAYKNGNEAFDKMDFTKARNHFHDAIKYFRKSGVKDSSDLLAPIRYNIAITYWNQQNWPRAKKYFLELKHKHPKFQKDKTEDYLNKLVELVDHSE